MFVPPKFKNAPGVVALGISSAPSIGTESLIRILVEGDDLKKLNEISLEVESIIKG